MPIPMSRPEGIARPPAALTNQPGTPAQQPGPTPIHVGAVGGGPGPRPPPAPPPPPPPTPANLPPSLLDKPARAPQVTLNGGSLAVDANNSSLSEILKDLETSSGMTVDGFDKDSRVFGVYGPGPPRDVISSLLEGAGYNFLLVGATDAGTPREIVLTTRGNAPISAPQPSFSQPEEEEEPPRTPQEMLQELQRIRQQQNQPGPQSNSPQ
jgi:hypothetical protein